MKTTLTLLSILISSLCFAQLTNKAEYNGYLKLIPAYKTQDSIKMSISITKLNDSIWTFKSVFDGGIIKDYQIIKRANNEFVLDEKNGILLPGVLNLKLLNFNYFVDERIYTVVYDLSDINNSLSYSLNYGVEQETVRTGNFDVKSIKIEGRQFGTFARKK